MLVLDAEPETAFASRSMSPASSRLSERIASASAALGSAPAFAVRISSSLSSSRRARPDQMCVAGVASAAAEEVAHSLVGAIYVYVYICIYIYIYIYIYI